MTSGAAPHLPGGRSLAAGRTLVTGILNVTPDSFSDGGLWSDPGAALAHGVRLLDEGADILDVGGESTRPHSRRIDADEEWARIARVVEGLVHHGAVVSVDTVHADTARRAVEAGAAIVNDVSGGRLDPQMAGVVASAGCAMVVQHWRAFPGSPEEDLRYKDVVADVLAETAAQVRDVLDAGVDPGCVVVDPGLGFSLSASQSWRIVEDMGRLRSLGYPVLVGASRKRFLATGPGVGRDRDRVTAEITRRAVEAGMWAVRVHEVAPSAAIVRAGVAGKERA